MIFLIIVPNRNSNTIKTVLDIWVHPDSNLKTDSWSAYYRATSDLNFNSHKTVNHSVEFVAPDGTNTQLVENLCCVLNKWIRKSTITTEILIVCWVIWQNLFLKGNTLILDSKTFTEF